jgi:hypothetical protein
MRAHSQSFRLLGTVRLLAPTVSATITAGHELTRPESKDRAYEVSGPNLSRLTKKQTSFSLPLGAALVPANWLGIDVVTRASR